MYFLKDAEGVRAYAYIRGILEAKNKAERRFPRSMARTHRPLGRRTRPLPDEFVRRSSLVCHLRHVGYISDACRWRSLIERKVERACMYSDWASFTRWFLHGGSDRY